jgi:putative ABC transport system permease protein
MISPLRYIRQSLIQYRSVHTAVALAVAAATAVLVGALLVGDSMRGSLRDLALDRLGRIDVAMTPHRFFREDLAQELIDSPDLPGVYDAAAPVVLLQGALLLPDESRRADRVSLLGCDDRFATLSSSDSYDAVASQFANLKDDEIVLNIPLARKLGILADDEDSIDLSSRKTDVLLRVPMPGGVHADSLLARKDNTIARARLTVVAIVPAEGLGRFSLRPEQQDPLNAYVSLNWFQGRLDQEGRVNALFVGQRPGSTPSEQDEADLRAALHPKIEDAGLQVRTLSNGIWDVSCEEMLFSDPLRTTVEDASIRAASAERKTQVLTYLVNEIRCGEASVPYSTAAALSFPTAEPFVNIEGKSITALADDEVALNAETAQRLNAKVGDLIRLKYFPSETLEELDESGEPRESTTELRVVAIVPMEGLGADPTLTPDVKGVTDQQTMRRWTPPFPYDPDRIGDEDEEYWDKYRAAPKLFVSQATGQRLWAGRFGRATSYRILGDEALEEVDVTIEFGPTDATDADDAELETSVADSENAPELPPPAALIREIENGLADSSVLFRFEPLRRNSIEASSGTTPFDVLFLSFSMFLIASSLMLVGLLFRLGIERRAAEIGTLAALGFERKKVAKLLLGEGLIVAGIGGLVGTPLGILYAQAMIYNLTTRWVNAIGTPFLTLHVTVRSILLGYGIALIASGLTICLTLRSLKKHSTRALLAGRIERTPRTKRRKDESSRLSISLTRRYAPLGIILILFLVAVVVALVVGENAQAGLFFGIGALQLIVALVAVRGVLIRGGAGRMISSGRGAIVRLAVRNAARHPGRSTLSIALIAVAGFMIIAISAFHIDPTIRQPDLKSGNGGFSLVAESDLPIHYDLANDDGRFDLGFSDEDEERLADVRMEALRIQPGDRASCLNLYQSQRPRILGVPDSMIDRDAFDWSSTLTSSDEQPNPWRALAEPLPPDEDGTPRLPVAVEKDTANYSLKIYAVGQTLDVEDEQGRPLRLVVVGILNNGIFQGDLLTGERLLLERFPNVSGYRYFLIETPHNEEIQTSTANSQTEATATLLNDRLGDYGFTAETTGQRMAGFLAVQNTYLLTFQTLGGLGLLLGTIGLGAVQLRNVLERRRELALLRAIGFERSDLAVLVLIENAFLLITGLLIGTATALIAILPHLLGGRAAVPWSSLAILLPLVLAIGLSSGSVAAWRASHTPLLGALKEEK